ncbi:MAG: zf-HC2 domain-containing protein [Acidobacteriota bacterium]
MDCQTFIESLTAFVDGELGAREREALESHLSRCRPCRQEQESLLHSYQLVDQLSSLEMDAGSWTRIHSEITQLPTAPPSWFTSLQSFFGSRWIPVTVGALGAASLSIFFLRDPTIEIQKEFQVYLEEREEMVLGRSPQPPQEVIREITTTLPNPFTVSYDNSQRNPFAPE